MSTKYLSSTIFLVVFICLGLSLFPSLSHAGTISPSLNPARTSGVAPLAVFFDASATTGSVTSAPFHDLLYTWSFGDSGAGTWTYGARPGVLSKNAAYGPVAGHIFETAGTYTVSLSIYDGTDTATTTTTITVSDPDTVFSGTATYCFSTSGTFTGCPSGATQVTTSDFDAAIASYQGTGRRLLFKRGDTFNVSAAGNLSAAGPGTVGAFGTGANPIINATSGGFAVAFVSGTDWRVMDLDIRGNSASNLMGTQADNATQATFLRLTIGGANMAFTTSNFATNDQYAVYDTVVTDTNGGVYLAGARVMWLFGTRTSIQGNSFDGAGGGSHVIRIPKANKAVISNNYIAHPGAGGELIKMHQANPFSDQATWDGTYTEQVILADNRVQGSANAPWTFDVQAQNGAYDERIRNIIVERNYLPTTGGSQIAIRLSAYDSTIRNNIINMTGAAYHWGIMVALYGGQPVPNNVSVYNNTFYSADGGGNFVGAADHETDGTKQATNSRFYNNLASAPNASGPVVVSVTGGTNLQSNNLLNNIPSSLFVSATPSVPADFRLISGSPAIGAGLAVPVWQDFLGSLRDSLKDIGAFEYISGGGGDTTPPAAPLGLSVS